MKQTKTQKSCPLAVLLIISWVVMSILGFYFVHYEEIQDHFRLDAQEIQENILSGQETYIAASFKGPVILEIKAADTLRKGRLMGYSLTSPGLTADSIQLLSHHAIPLIEQEITENAEEVLAEEAAVEVPVEPEPISIFQWAPRDPAPPRSDCYDDPQAIALDTYAPYVTVDDSYFDDAVFIGDSRIEGLSMHGKLDNADFIYARGLWISELLTDYMYYTHAGQFNSYVYLEPMLKEHDYKKIYLCYGINDLGFGNAVTYQESYLSLVEDIREWCPDAIIFICSIMNFSTYYSDQNFYDNNDNINARNFRLAQLADGETIFYIDENVVFNDETGGLDEKYTNDAIHLTAEYYPMMVDFIKTRGILIENVEEVEEVVEIEE